MNVKEFTKGLWKRIGVWVTMIPIYFIVIAVSVGSMKVITESFGIFPPRPIVVEVHLHSTGEVSYEVTQP